LYSYLTSHDAHALGICLAKKQPINPFFFRGQVKVWRSYSREKERMESAKTAIASFGFPGAVD
jgi:hypothetical protein